MSADMQVTVDRIDAAIGRPDAFAWLPQLREHGDAPMPNRGEVLELWSGPELLGLMAGWLDEAQRLPWDDQNADPAVLLHNNGMPMRGPGGHVEIPDAYIRNFQATIGRPAPRARLYMAPVGTELGEPGWTEITGATIDASGFGEA